MIRQMEFEGIPSGDYECFCFAVDRETFVRLKGEEPDEHDENDFHEGMFKIYPGTLFGHSEAKIQVKVEVKE